MTHRRTPLLAALVLLCAPGAHAQTVFDPSGHWEGRIEAPGFEQKFEIDVAKDSAGKFSGTISIPAQHIAALPAKTISVEGTAFRFVARDDQPINGYFSADGRTLTGDVTAEGFAIPMSMTRTGEARIEPPARTAAVDATLEGTWNASLAIDKTTLRVMLTIENHRDGTSTVRLVNVDQGNVEIPASAVTQTPSGLTLDFKSVGASYESTVDAGANELVGTYKQGSGAVPVTFRRGPLAQGK
jgi:hypothetical protein